MTAMLHDLADREHCVQLSNKQFDALLARGVLLPAGLYSSGKHHYTMERSGDGANIHTFTATPAMARACGMAMRGFADAVRYASENRREWVTDLDRANARMTDEVVEFFATCNGFRIS